MSSCNYRRYWLAHDCPNCGAKDERYDHYSGSWGGARMGSTAWGHSFSCCSDACGQAFAASWRRQPLAARNWPRCGERWPVSRTLACVANRIPATTPRVNCAPWAGYPKDPQ